MPCTRERDEKGNREQQGLELDMGMDVACHAQGCYVMGKDLTHVLCERSL